VLFSRVTIYFKFPDGSQKTAAAKVGDNLLDAVISNHLDIDGYGTITRSVCANERLRCSVELAVGTFRWFY
jgi:hypothetical protein